MRGSALVRRASGHLLRPYCSRLSCKRRLTNVVWGGMNAEKMDHRLIWIDCEMTGLDASRQRIVEIACVVTEGDESLAFVAKGPDIVIHQPAHVLDQMDDWCVNQFRKNGLVDEIKASRRSEIDAEHEVIRFVEQHTRRGCCPLAGNSVGSDRVFLNKYMPFLAQHLHYRNVDVSSVKELCRRWYPDEFRQMYPKKSAHRAMDDILESIEELRYYKTRIFR